MAGTFPISGHIDPNSFPFLLVDLHRNGATGSLKVEGPTYQKALYFRGGRVLFGSSNDPRDQLGAILIEEGRITPEQLEDVNSKVGPGNPLAKVLSETGFVSQRELSEAARAKVERILSDLIAYTSGSFEFEDGVLPKGAVDLKLSTERLVLSAVRRVSDRGFVLRHLGGLDVVLRPTADLVAKREEVEPETGGLLSRIDGIATLKEAASPTRLEEFEAAKIATGLLFLGLVERVGTEAVQDEAPLLDLGEAARAALDDEPWVAADAPAAPQPEAPLPAWLRGDEPPSDAASPLAWSGAEPALSVTAEPEWAPPSAVAVADVPTARDAPLPDPPMAPMPPPQPPAVSPARVWTPPAVAAAATPPRSSHPSKDELAALDALLDPRTLEGPLAPLERAPEPRVAAPARPVQARRSAAGPSRAILLTVAAGVVLAGGAAAWFFWLRPSRAAAVTTAVTPTPRPPASPAAVSAGGGPVAVPTPGAAVASPAATGTVRAAEGDAGGVRRARDLLRGGNLGEAARGFESNLRSAPTGTLSVQLLVACSPDTVQKAVANVSAPELFILPVSYKGRDCFRMCWGLYSDAASAASAARSLPEYFVRGGAAPRVLNARELLP